MQGKELLAAMEKAVISGNKADSIKFAKEALAAGVKALDAIDNGLVKGMTIVGDKYAKHEYFLDMLFENYELCVYVDTDVGDAEHYEGLSRRFAEELGLRHENRPCGTGNLARFLHRARELARTAQDRAQ